MEWICLIGNNHVLCPLRSAIFGRSWRTGLGQAESKVAMKKMIALRVFMITPCSDAPRRWSLLLVDAMQSCIDIALTSHLQGVLLCTPSVPMFHYADQCRRQQPRHRLNTTIRIRPPCTYIASCLFFLVAVRAVSGGVGHQYP